MPFGLLQISNVVLCWAHDNRGLKAVTRSATRKQCVLALPAGAQWPVLGYDDEGAIVLREGFIREVERTNGLRRGSLREDVLAKLLVQWYAARRCTEGAHDTVAERLARELGVMLPEHPCHGIAAH